ncbi:MAG: efflux RND transporter periplasmic adaptor subunit [Bacteroidetes bacterium]|nr:efflux RND transporter periplasmic adaptor subunit [Bacteroidota bacterium]MBS1539037.1 efflux RND transporter periplasmic adaptor subunit [Bacteroidota bacterium]
MNILSYRTINLLMAGSALLAACSGGQTEEAKKDKPVEVLVRTVAQQNSSTISASGRVESAETAVVSTRIMGFVTSIKVKAGDKVQKGQLLATISNTDILAKRAQAQALIAEAEAALADAQKDYERFQDLYKKQSASAKELENITLKYNSIRAKAEAARQMKNEADAMLAYTNLTAPFTGTIIQRAVDEGSMANPGMPILMMEQDGDLQIAASVTESEISNLKVGTSAQVTIKSVGKNFNSKIIEVSPSSQFNGGQYSIKVSIPENNRQDLHSGMYATLSIGIEKKGIEEGRLLVPSSAIIKKDQLTGVYTVSDNQLALLHWVKLGKNVDNVVEVLSGLNANEKLIVQSEGKLYNGVPVRVK